MRLGEVDLSLKPLKASYFLCKPDKTVISPLKDITSPNLSRKLGKVNEFTFSIPTMIERNRELIENPLIDKIKHRYLIKLDYNSQIEYFVFLDQNKQFDDSNENISYQAFSLGYLIADKSIRSYEAVSKSLTEMATDALAETEWKVGYVDAYFDTKLRSHEIPSQTVLQAIYELADKFNAVIIWDTVNLEISFYNPSNIGINKGLKFKEGKYLESFNVSTNSEEMVTRLKVYGKEGLTFRSLSPTGSNYIEDFSWFMYPFSRVGGIVVTQSDYMSDSLCIALEDYALVLDANQTQFNTLNTNLTAKQDAIQQAEQELSVLQSDLIQIMDELDILNEAGLGGTAAHIDAVNRRVAKEAEVQTKINEIATLDADEQLILTDINNLRVTVAIETTLSPSNILELNKYIIEKEYTNDTIVEEQDLLEDGIDAFNKLREPKLNMSMSITNFLSNVESQNDWDKLTLGDIVKLESKRLRIGIEAKIIEINYDFESDGTSLVIANEKELKDDYRKLMDLLYNASATSTIVSMDKYKWDLIEETDSVVGQLLNNTWETIKRNITAGYMQNIEISERGIIIKSPSDPLSWLVIQNGQLAITNDSGNSWKTAIHKGGIVAERILGKLILGQKLIIEDENGIIKITGNLQEIFNDLGEVQVALGEYEVGKYGLRVYNGAVDIRTSSIDNRGVVLDQNGLRAYSNIGSQTLNIDTTTGNATFSGNLLAATGTFSGDLQAAGGTFSGTLNGVDGVFTGNLEAVSGTFVELTSGIIKGVTIESATIDIEDSIQVGNTITLGKNSFGYKSIIFSQNSSIYQPDNTVSLVMDTIGYIFIGGDVKFARYNGGTTTLDFTGAVINNLNVVAKFG